MNKNESKRPSPSSKKRTSSKKKSNVDLVPPDIERCQAEVPNGYNFMTLGGVPGRVRCSNKPSVIITEKIPGSDGKCGSMSLCDDCLAVFKKQKPELKVTVDRIIKVKLNPETHLAIAMCVGFSGDWTLERIQEEWFDRPDDEKRRNLRAANEFADQLNKFGYEVVRIKKTQ